MLHMARKGPKSGSRPVSRDSAPLTDKEGPPDVGAILRSLRRQHGLSLETLSKLSGVSRAMLGQIETGKSMPTITLIWKIAKALGVPATALIAHPFESRATVIATGDTSTVFASHGLYRIRPYSHPNAPQPFDLCEIHIAPGHRETVNAFTWGTRATLIVTAGTIEMAIDGEPPTRLNSGTAVLFQADIAHSFFNPLQTDATAYLIVAPSQKGAL